MNIKAGYLNCPVRPYIPNPMRCFQCQRFGHSKMSCRGSITCARCSQIGHDCENCTAAPLFVNCKGEHPAFSRLCPKWKSGKEVQTTKVKRNISYAEARRLVQSTQVDQIHLTPVLLNHLAQLPPKLQLVYRLNKTQPIISSKKKENPTHIVQRQETVIERKPKNLTQKTVNKNRSPSNSSLDGIISESVDSDSMEIEEGLEVPTYLLPRKTKKQ
ncbi:hypothetical protein X975_21863, partial [Stegodyphus mimosarum]